MGAIISVQANRTCIMMMQKYTWFVCRFQVHAQRSLQQHALKKKGWHVDICYEQANSLGVLLVHFSWNGICVIIVHS